MLDSGLTECVLGWGVRGVCSEASTGIWRPCLGGQALVRPWSAVPAPTWPAGEAAGALGWAWGWLILSQGGGAEGEAGLSKFRRQSGKGTPDCPWAEARRVQGGGPGESSWMSGHHMAMGGPPDCHSQSVALLSFLLFWDKMTQDMRFPGTLVPRKSLGQGASGNMALEVEECPGEAVPLCSVWSRKPGTEVRGDGDHLGRGGQPEADSGFPAGLTLGCRPLKHLLT